MKFEIYFLNNISDSISMAETYLDSYLDWISYMVDENTDIESEMESEDPYSLKHVIINLWDGIELVVKFRLMEEHWAFIFSDINKASREKLDTGDFISVDFVSATQRLDSICDIEFDFKFCHKLRNLRNKIVHYTLTSTYEETWNIIANAIIELSKFMETEIIDLLPESAKEDFNKDIRSLQTHSKSLIDLKNAYYKKVNKRTQEVNMATEPV